MDAKALARHPLRPRLPVVSAEYEPAPVSTEALVADVPFAARGLDRTVTRIEALARALGLEKANILQNLRLNLLGLAEAAGPSAHFVEVGAASQRSATTWAQMIEALEDGDAARLARTVESTPDGKTALEDLLLHYRFSFSADAVQRWTALAEDLISLTDHDFRRADLYRELNGLELTVPESERRFVEVARRGLSHGLLGPDEVEALVTAHAFRRLRRASTAQVVDGRAVRGATLSALRALAELGRLPDLRGRKVTTILVESPCNAASHAAVRQKARLFAELGLDAQLHVLPADTDLPALEERIEAANRDPDSLGTIVQLPLADRLRPALDKIRPERDLDGLGPRSLHGGPASAEAAVRAVENVVGDGEQVVVLGSRGAVGSSIVRTLAKAGIRAVGDALSDRGDPRGDAAFAGRLQARRVAAVISAADRPDAVSPQWCARYGLDPERLKMIVDVGFVAEVTDDRPLGTSASVSRAVAQSADHTPVPGGVGPMALAVLAERVVSARLEARVRIWRVDERGQVGVERGWASRLQRRV